MSNIFPLARSKRVKSVRQVLLLHKESELLVQPKIEGTSCHLVFSDGKIFIRNRIGFDITKSKNKKKYFKELEISAQKYKKLHALCVVSENHIILYDCTEVDDIKMFNMSADQRVSMLESLDIFSENVSCIDTYRKLDALKSIKLSHKEVVFKLKSSKYPVKNKRGREPIADWYALSLHTTGKKDVILSSYHTGSSKQDLVFKCVQYSKGKTVSVGKVRIEDRKNRETIVKIIDNGKKVVCEVVESHSPTQKNHKKLTFIRQVRDKPFSSVVVDRERNLSSVEVVNINTKKIESFKL